MNDLIVQFLSLLSAWLSSGSVSLISETFLGPESRPCLTQKFCTGSLLEATDRLSKPLKPNKNAPKDLMYWALMKIITKMGFIGIQTLRQTISNSLQTLRKAHAHALQTLCKLFLNALQTPFKRFTNSFKTLSNALETPSKPFQTLYKPFWKHFKLFPNPLQTPCKRHLRAFETPFGPNWNVQ